MLSNSCLEIWRLGLIGEKPDKSDAINEIFALAMAGQNLRSCALCGKMAVDEGELSYCVECARKESFELGQVNYKHKPYSIEVNGPAAIIQEFDHWKRGITELSLSSIEMNARKSLIYMKQLSGYSPKAWHEIEEPKCL